MPEQGFHQPCAVAVSPEGLVDINVKMGRIFFAEESVDEFLSPRDKALFNPEFAQLLHIGRKSLAVGADILCTENIALRSVRFINENENVLRFFFAVIIAVNGK